MNWKEVERHPFNYCGKPVLRKKLVSATLFGDFEVFEAVNGQPYVRHPFIKSPYIGPLGFDNGLEEWFGKPKAPCKSIEDGIAHCELVMEWLKKQVNSY